MSEPFKIFFIDDELNSSDDTQANVRVALVEQLNKDPRFNVTSYHPVDFISLSSEDQIKVNPDLIIVDYKLSGGGNSASERYHGTGYSMTSYCKERYPDVPCYLISQLIDEDVSVSEHYDKKISHRFLTKQSGRDALASDCHSYIFLKDCISKYKGDDLIIKALNAPSEEVSNLKISIPSEYWNENSFKRQQSITDSQSTIIKFTKWINTTLLKRRGPLINSLELATLLGVTQDFLENGDVSGPPLINLFNGQRYCGLFHDSSSSKWWAQQCYNKAIEILEGEGGVEPWKSIPLKMNISPEHYSNCPVCQKNQPETVAKDKDSGIDYPCHWACCVGGDITDDIVGFEPQLYLDV